MISADSEFVSEVYMRSLYPVRHLYVMVKQRIVLVITVQNHSLRLNIHSMQTTSTTMMPNRMG